MNPETPTKPRWRLLCTDAQRRSVRVGDRVGVLLSDGRTIEADVIHAPLDLSGTPLVWLDKMIGGCKLSRVIAVRLSESSGEPAKETRSC